jgi:molybdate transport system substrate-binding protein
MRFFSLFISIVLIFGGCPGNSGEQNADASKESGALTISAAVSLKDAFNEMADLYKSKTGKSVSFNFGASGALQRQIETGAPVDVFASAGAAQMDALAAKNLIDPQSRRDFARNTLVLIFPADSKLNAASFAELAKPEFRKIAVGNPKTVPAGQYTEQLFGKLNLKPVVEPKLIIAEDVRQVLDYVVRGETDAGVVYASDARSAGGKVRVADVRSEGLHSPILYPIAAVADSKQKQSAREFIDLVLSAEGQSILSKYGFALILQ